MKFLRNLMKLEFRSFGVSEFRRLVDGVTFRFGGCV